ncbi:MAG: hypothetical protein P1V19_02475 [Gimesia sp.]|nr:hypothetical protein [Gimesia sp.]
MMYKSVLRNFLAACITFWLGCNSHLSAQEGPNYEGLNKSELKHEGIILRVSKSLIDEFTDDVIEAEIPFQARILNGNVTGTAKGRATTSIEMQPGKEEAAFIITAKGEASGCFQGTRGKTRVDGTVTATFVVKKRVLFDGMHYFNGNTSSEVSLTTSVSQVESQRILPFRVLTQPVAKTGVKLLQSEAEQQAIPYAIQYLEEFVNAEADAIIAELNQTIPLERSLHKLFPETKDWIYQLSTAEKYLQAYYGPKDAPVPTPPAVPGRPKNPEMELWIQANSKDAKFIQLMARLNQSHNLLKKLIPDADPLIASLIKNARVTFSAPWLIISITASEKTNLQK